MSNNHVLAHADLASGDEGIIQAGLVDNSSIPNPDDVVARLPATITVNFRLP
jgi:hypothetical protein